MNNPSPAIIAQSAVRRLPRLALLLFCISYILPGFLARNPWKYEDIAAFGVMRELASTSSHWLHPQLLGQSNTFDALVPYWLGAIAIKLLPFMNSALAVRIPFGLLLALTLFATWQAIYCLARTPQAQPVAFAFGGEAHPLDYARAMADAGLLALIASLGLAQLSHETTPTLAQLGFTALTFYAMAANPYDRATNLTRGVRLALSLVIGLVGLALSGAPTLAVLFGLGGALVEWSHQRWGNDRIAPEMDQHSWRWILFILGATVLVALLAYGLDLWRWRIHLPGATDASAGKNWRSLGRLLLWFTWPVWPLALWTLWRWHRQLRSRHLALPLWFASMSVVATLTTSASDRSLLLSLPALAALAAFALPTLKRSVASLIDWFTLIFFTACTVIIWVIWIAMQTGIPQQPAANVEKLAPGFEPSFSGVAFLTAVAATVAWTWLIKWRVSSQRRAVWKSLVLPAGGATLCWLLLMTLWLPLLNYARSYESMSRQIANLVDQKRCVDIYGVDNAQATALQYYAQLELRRVVIKTDCPYLIVEANSQSTLENLVNLSNWAFKATVHRPTDKNDSVLIFKRVSFDDDAENPQAISPQS